MNLRLDHHHRIALSEKVFGGPVCLFQGLNHLAAWNRHTILPQNLFCLILVNFHSCLRYSARAKSVANRNNSPQCETRTMVRLSQLSRTRNLYFDLKEVLITQRRISGEPTPTRSM